MMMMMVTAKLALGNNLNRMETTLRLISHVCMLSKDQKGKKGKRKRRD